MKTTINNAAKACQTLSANATLPYKPANFTNVDLWNIHKLVKSRVYRKYM